VKKNIVIVGGGHNGLVVAAYLAKAGHEVTVLEKRSVVGGCASSDTTTFPGFTISTAAYLNSLFLPEIVEDLSLRQHGYEVFPRDPSSFTPLPDGRFLMLGPDMAFNQSEIAKFSLKDVKAYPWYEKKLSGVAKWMAGLMTMTPPNFFTKVWLPKTLRNWVRLFQVLWYARKLFPLKIFTLLRLIFSDPVKYLDSWFESDVLKATLLTDALIGATKLSGYVLLHHVMGESGGARGVWAYQKGGMGGIANALKSVALSYGAHICCNAEVIEIGTESLFMDKLLVKFKQGDDKPCSMFADVVVSNLDVKNTLSKIRERERKKDRLMKSNEAIDYSSASMKINLVLSGLPDFQACPGTVPGPQHRGTIHIAPSVEYILRALRELADGRFSSLPMLELTIPSVLDPTLAPKGMQVMNVFTQFFPYGETFNKYAYWEYHVLPLLRSYITNIDNIICDVQIFTPNDLESEFGLSGGNLFHGALSLGKLFSLRPARGIADYRTPISGLYLCGASTHPGGGVTGAPGYNAAREILEDIGKSD